MDIQQLSRADSSASPQASFCRLLSLPALYLDALSPSCSDILVASPLTLCTELAIKPTSHTFKWKWRADTSRHGHCLVYHHVSPSFSAASYSAPSSRFVHSPFQATLSRAASTTLQKVMSPKSLLCLRPPNGCHLLQSEHLACKRAPGCCSDPSPVTSTPVHHGTRGVLCWADACQVPPTPGPLLFLPLFLECSPRSMVFTSFIFAQMSPSH